ncbi:MAG: RluA family pseudouridine synthase [Lachnospiraceae bacterium]|uniref:RNA pseudouridylate synthase n=1 Tax=Candidatus Weimeria bifida TaxID=2599074 RepID=A0A6N7J0G6_9FIRM|nr:RluA family pseudouridine synthase [Candidatus Weimeria bifida]RRF96972.1 MAG: RluA family pseudouridine synthase [Lachnospiraceae bacterium]
MKELIISEANEKERLNKYLSHLLSNASMGFIYKMLRKKNITLNGKKASGNELLKSGDIIKIFFSDETYDKFTANDRGIVPAQNPLEPLTVLYEDSDIIAVHKPAGLLSQSDKRGGDCVNSRILFLLSSRGEMETGFTPSIVNRLDRNTSGIVLAGKTYRGSRMLSDLIQSRDVIKTYYCIADGHFKREGIYRVWHTENKDNTVNVSDKETEGAKEIVTEFFPERYSRSHTLIRIILHTGRKHQIRASLSHLGYPVTGDSKYGKGHEKHMYLHAFSVRIPGIGTIEDPLPDYFRRFMDADI